MRRRSNPPQKPEAEKSAASVLRPHNAHPPPNPPQMQPGWQPTDQGEPQGIFNGPNLPAERSLAEQKYDLAFQQYRQMQEIAPKNPMVLNLAWAWQA